MSYLALHQAELVELRLTPAKAERICRGVCSRKKSDFVDGIAISRIKAATSS
jgi:hypothetical protein